MEKIGVEAVVEGLSGFLGDMKKMDSAISGLVPGTKLLENAFGFLGNTIDGFVNFTLNTLAHALGELVADAVEFVIQKLGELVQATIEAGGEFQTLELRLQTLNFNSLVESGMKYNEATAKSIELTREQLDWLQKLAVTTPYDAQDIANTFTLARSYGFVNDEAQRLTESITNFASGMGLGNTEIQRIIVNFGQMVQQGKTTQREMNDLARGSFVPVNDVLKIMSENTGIAMESMDDFRKTAESVPEFIKAFIQLVDTRFTGSAEKMASTFQGATANLKDLVKSLGGMNVVKPILDVIGKRIATFISTLTEGKNWDKLVNAAQHLGNALAGIVSTLTGFLPDAKSVAQGVIDSLNGIAKWVNLHKSDITDWIITSSRWINNVLIPDIQRVVKWLFGTSMEKGAFQKFGEWIMSEFVPAIQNASRWVGEVFIPFLKNDLQPVALALLPLLSAIGEVLIKAFGGEPNQSFTDWIHNSLIPGIIAFTDWINQNQDTIALWVERLIVATVQLAILVAAIGLVVTAVSTIVAAFVDWLVVSGNWLKVGLAIGVVLALIALDLNAILLPILAIIVAIGAMILAFTALRAFFTKFVEEFKAHWAEFADAAAESVIRVQDAFKNGDWIGVGKAIVEGVAQGIANEAALLVNATIEAAAAAVNAVQGMLGFGSSFASPGAMAPSTVNSNTTNTNNYNLAINSSAQHEPIVQDFFMMQSFHGR